MNRIVALLVSICVSVLTAIALAFPFAGLNPAIAAAALSTGVAAGAWQYCAGRQNREQIRAEQIGICSAERAESFAKKNGCRLARTARRVALFAAVDEAVEKSSGGDDRRAGEKIAAIAELETNDAASSSRGTW